MVARPSQTLKTKDRDSVSSFIHHGRTDRWEGYEYATYDHEFIQTMSISHCGPRRPD